MTAFLIGKMTISALENVNNNLRGVSPPSLCLWRSVSHFYVAIIMKGHKGIISRNRVNQPCERV